MEASHRRCCLALREASQVLHARIRRQQLDVGECGALYLSRCRSLAHDSTRHRSARRGGDGACRAVPPPACDTQAMIESLESRECVSELAPNV
eukprot:31686-Eustigmatos_ZCMA.PRE.1